MSEFTFQTKVLHGKHRIEPTYGGVSVPIHHTSTHHQYDIDAFGKYDYNRAGNPTREALEDTIAELEGGTRGFAFSSGMAAISTAFLLLSAGDHVIITEDVYGGTYRFVTEVLGRMGISYTYVDMTDIEKVREAIQPNTKVIYMETPSNPTLKITDIRALTQLAKEVGALTFLDNTFMTPQLQRPLELGVDVVLHSATKFLGGHSDVLAGLAVVNDSQLAYRLEFLQKAFGAVLGVQDAWLVMRGIKTLHVRMEQSMKAALQLASYLEHHSKVKRVYYPGLASHEGYEIHQEQAYGPGAVLSFELCDEDTFRLFVEKIKIPVFAVSLGGVESILSYPAKMSHAAMPQEEREKRGISNTLLRFSVGLENIEDILQDFEQALR
ncbi:cystathionine beta-lyase [Priestia taiwanensis]|uniref:cysteine-S-conjugate beta-lyase n=1 Tax=Priestia taiwanensis TaxID=1347902 RepID=A0A917EPH1_9BACI|nr:cystathionine beta-lyase [Priestia taiwanensis]MBM7363026.1 cystathionine beta-lyase [Priestia taiwanensis]GGE66998.1 cystathionine gamma-synthase [Priestia taiwanensis]